MSLSAEYSGSVLSLVKARLDVVPTCELIRICWYPYLRYKPLAMQVTIHYESASVDSILDYQVQKNS
jgi:hypothetical protein